MASFHLLFELTKIEIKQEITSNELRWYLVCFKKSLAKLFWDLDFVF